MKLTPQEQREILAGRAAGESFASIGRRLQHGHTWVSERYRWLTMGKEPDKHRPKAAPVVRVKCMTKPAAEGRGPRECLMCGRMFDSWGPGNRICNVRRGGHQSCADVVRKEGEDARIIVHARRRG